MEEVTITLRREGTDIVTNREEFAAALKMWRVRNGLTQTDLAKKAGLSRWTIIRVEKAQRLNSWQSIYKLFSVMAEKQ